MTITIVHQTNGQNGTNGTSIGSNGDTARQTSGAAKLRKMLNETNDLIVCPGVYDGLSARIALSLGFEAMYMVRDVQHPKFSVSATNWYRPVLERLPRDWERQIWDLPSCTI